MNTQRPEVRASADDELGEAIEQSENAQQELARLTPELNDLMEQVCVCVCCVAVPMSQQRCI